MKKMLFAGILTLAASAFGANSLASGSGTPRSAPHFLLVRRANGPKAKYNRGRRQRSLPKHQSSTPTIHSPLPKAKAKSH